MVTKVCAKCGIELDISNFNKHNGTRDRLYPYCKACRRELEQIRKASVNNPISVTEKICGRCKASKPSDAFSRNRYASDGLGYMCRECDKLNKKARYYGLSPEAYNKMLTIQDNKCCICECVMDEPHVDHCHENGKVRGLLCTRCNVLIGMAKDKTQTLASAIEYLSKHQEEKYE